MMTLQGVALVTVTMFGLGIFLGWALHAPTLIDTKICTVKTDEEEAAKAAEEEIVGEVFTVTGKPRKPTWRQRRKELEAAARTKRKRLEEWRD